MDRRTSLSYPNGITTSYAYDDAYRLTAIVPKDKQKQIVDAWSYGCERLKFGVDLVSMRYLRTGSGVLRR